MNTTELQKTCRWRPTRNRNTQRSGSSGTRKACLALLGGLLAVAGCKPPNSTTVSAPQVTAESRQDGRTNMSEYQPKTDAEWQRILTPEQFKVLRKHGTERAFTGEHWKTKEPGTYACAGCGLELFGSDHKFDSGTGWPSYWQPLKEQNVGITEDRSFFMRRVEVHCARCQGHLGHVFEDGPAPTGLRYCINSASLKFQPKP